MATASDITKHLISFIEDVWGSGLKASDKAKLDVIVSIIGTLGDDLTPILESRFDVEGVFAGVQDVRSSATQMDNGVKNHFENEAAKLFYKFQKKIGSIE